MILGYPFMTLPFASVDAALDASVANPLRALLDDPDARLIFLLEATPDDVDDDTMTATPYQVYLSDYGFKTKPSDTPANKHYAGRLDNPYNFESSISVEQAGRGNTAFGVINVVNSDGELDELIDLSWNNENVELKVGGIYHEGRVDESVFDYIDFGRVFLGKVSGLSADEEIIRLNLRNPAERFKGIIQETLYAGTGGAEGDESLKSRPKPLAWGINRKVPVVLVSALYDIYQLNDGPIEDVLGVWDKGVELDFDADYASYALLQAATIATGEYSTCIAEGFLRLGAPADGVITCDFKGDNDPSAPDGLGYVDTAAGIVRRIVGTRGPQPITDSADYDLASFTDFPGTQPIGIYIGTEPRAVEAVLDEAMGSVGGFWLFRRNSAIRLARLDAPDSGSVRSTERTIEDGSLKVEESNDPVWRVRLGYRRYRIVQDGSAIATSVGSEERADLGQEYRYVSSDETLGQDIKTAYPQAREIEILTNIDDETDAQSECDRLLNLYGRHRKIWQYTETRNLFKISVCQSVRVTHNRLGFEDGRNVVVIGIAESAGSRRTLLTVWG